MAQQIEVRVNIEHTPEPQKRSLHPLELFRLGVEGMVGIFFQLATKFFGWLFALLVRGLIRIGIRPLRSKGKVYQP